MRAPNRFVASALAAAIAFGSAGAFCAGVDPGKATPVQREQAQVRFLKGKTFFAQKKYEDALTELRASMEIVESPNTRLSIARCLREMGRLVAAYVEFGRTEVEANELSTEDPRYKKAGEAASIERKSLGLKLGFVTVTVSNATDESKLVVGGEEVRRAAWNEPTPVVAGETEVVLETPGKPPVKKSITVAAGAKESLAIDANGGATPVATETKSAAVTVVAPPVAGSDRSGLRPYAYVAGAIGAAGIVSFVVFGALSNGVYHDLQNNCSNGCASASDDVSRGKRYQTIANIGLVVGLVGAAAGVTLFVLSAPKNAPRTEVALTPTGFSVRGSF